METSTIFGYIIALALLIWIVPLAIVWAWSLCMPAIFGLPQITWLQALGLWCLSAMFFAKK